MLASIFKNQIPAQTSSLDEFFPSEGRRDQPNLHLIFTDFEIACKEDVPPLFFPLFFLTFVNAIGQLNNSPRNTTFLMRPLQKLLSLRS